MKRRKANVDQSLARATFLQTDDRCRDLLCEVLGTIVDDFSAEGPNRANIKSRGVAKRQASAIRAWVVVGDRGRVTFSEVCEYVGLPEHMARECVLALPRLQEA